MGSTTEWAPEQLFTVDSSRILFTARGGFGGRGQQPEPQPPTGSSAFRYKIETLRDGATFDTVLDKTGNTTTKYTEFDELPPTQCRFVRLTITDWPHIANAPLGIGVHSVRESAGDNASGAMRIQSRPWRIQDAPHRWKEPQCVRTYSQR